MRGNLSSKYNRQNRQGRRTFCKDILQALTREWHRKFKGDLGEKFHRPEKQSPYNKGLGLHYSAMMCKLHRGSLEYNAGSSGTNQFIVKLPRG